MADTITASTESPVDAEDEERPAGISRGRSIAVWTLIVVATLIAVLASTNVWVERQALDTGAWVDASDELLQDPDVTRALSEYLVNELYRTVDVQAALAERLPEQVQGLAGPAAAALRQPATEAVEFLMQTDQFRSVWRTLNREAHTVLVNILEDNTRVGSTAGGVVSLDLRQLVSQVGQQLGLSEAVLDRIPEDAGNIVIARSSQLEDLQTAVKVVQWLSVLLLLVVLGMYALAVYLAAGARRVTLRNVGWALVVVGLVLLVGRRLGINFVASEVDDPAYRPAAKAAFGIGSEILSQMGWAVILYGILVVLGAILAGPTRVGTSIRRAISPALNGPVGLVWGGAVVIFLLLVLWSPTPAFDTWYTVLILAVLGAVGLAALRRQTLREFPDTSFREMGDSVVSGARSARSSLARPDGQGAAAGQVEQLERLSALHASGALDDDEFAAAKRDLLGNPVAVPDP